MKKSHVLMAVGTLALVCGLIGLQNDDLGKNHGKSQNESEAVVPIETTKVSSASTSQAQPLSKLPVSEPEHARDLVRVAQADLDARVELYRRTLSREQIEDRLKALDAFEKRENWVRLANAGKLTDQQKLLLRDHLRTRHALILASHALEEKEGANL